MRSGSGLNWIIGYGSNGSRKREKYEEISRFESLCRTGTLTRKSKILIPLLFFEYGSGTKFFEDPGSKRKKFHPISHPFRPFLCSAPHTHIGFLPFTRVHCFAFTLNKDNEAKEKEKEGLFSPSPKVLACWSPPPPPPKGRAQGLVVQQNYLLRGNGGGGGLWGGGACQG